MRTDSTTATGVGACRPPNRRPLKNVSGRTIGGPMAPRIMLTSFGYNDSGGGTIVPRHVSQELARRGWDVTVFHAAVGRIEDARAVRGAHLGRGRRAADRRVQPPARPARPGQPAARDRRPADHARVRRGAGRHRPDVVHFHNLHNLGAALVDEAAARGIPAYFSTHNYWLVCPRNYLYTERLELCHGPGDRGAACATCVGSRRRRRLPGAAGRDARALRSRRRRLPGRVGGDASGRWSRRATRRR